MDSPTYTVQIEGKEFEIPAISPDGKQLTQDEALELFKQNGIHMGQGTEPMSNLGAAFDPQTVSLGEIPQESIGSPVPTTGGLGQAGREFPKLTAIGSGAGVVDNPEASLQSTDDEESPGSQSESEGGAVPAPSRTGKEKIVKYNPDGSFELSNKVTVHPNGSTTYDVNGVTFMQPRFGAPVKLPQPKWQKEKDQTGRIFEINPQTRESHEVTPEGYTPSPKPTAAQQIVNQIQRQENTNVALKNWIGAYTKYNQIASNASKPFDQRTSADDAALINAHAGAELPGQAVSTEQLKLAQEGASWEDWMHVEGSKFSGHPRILSDRQVTSFLDADHRAVEEARTSASKQLQPFLARAKEAGAPVQDIMGIDPAQPLQKAEAGSGSWKSLIGDAGQTAAPATQAATPNGVYRDKTTNKLIRIKDGVQTEIN